MEGRACSGRGVAGTTRMAEAGAVAAAVHKLRGEKGNQRKLTGEHVHVHVCTYMHMHMFMHMHI